MPLWLDSVQRFFRAHAFLFLILSYVLFIIFGAVIFMAIEQPEESSLVAEMRELRTRFLDDNSCVRESGLEDLLRKALFASKRGVAVLDSDSDEYNFDFTSSLFFVTTFLTTTGYGTSMPLSDEGRIFSMLYCLLGIPLTVLLLSCLTHALQPRVTHAPVCYLQTYWGLSHGRASLIYAGLLATSTASLFFLLPAAALCFLERDWSFLESLYFCFISLSTIGLGEYLPGRIHSRAGRQGLEFATSCYLVVGLVVLLVVLETFRKLQPVQAIVRLFAGPREGELKGVALDELVLGEDSAPPDNPEKDPQYTLAISTISPALRESLPLPTPEQTATPSSQPTTPEP